MVIKTQKKTRGNPPVRIWGEVKEVYKEVSREYGIAISDLVSIVLLYAPVFSPFVTALGLEDNFDDISRDVAIIISQDLAERMKRLVGITFPGEQEEEKMKEVKKVA